MLMVFHSLPYSATPLICVMMEMEIFMLPISIIMLSVSLIPPRTMVWFILFIYFKALLFSLHFLSTVSTFAGTGADGEVNGPVLGAEFESPFALFCQQSTSSVFVLDNNQYLRKIQNGLLIFFDFFPKPLSHFYLYYYFLKIEINAGNVTTLNNLNIYSQLSMDSHGNLYCATPNSPSYIYSYNTTNGLDICNKKIIHQNPQNQKKKGRWIWTFI